MTDGSRRATGGWVERSRRWEVGVADEGRRLISDSVRAAEVKATGRPAGEAASAGGRLVEGKPLGQRHHRTGWG